MHKHSRIALLALALTSSFFGCASSKYSANAKVYYAFLDGKARIVGFVSDRSSSEMLPATVSVEGTHYWAKADENGYYHIGDLSTGKHYLDVTLAGYEFVRHYEIIVDANQIIRLDFELELVTVYGIE